jgi:hypothetical protein
MTLELRGALAEMVRREPRLAQLSEAELLEAACAVDMGLWSEVKRGYHNAEVHWLWYQLAQFARRAAVLAPREHGKSEIFSVNNAAHHSIYSPGFWTYIFCNSGDQGEKILARAVAAIAQVAPHLTENPKVMHTKEVVLSNDARITVRGSGAAVRGAHPDLIIGDDVQDENNTATQMQRDRLKQWWFGTVGGMAHPGTTRVVQMRKRPAEVMSFPATRILLVGTPFHSLDLLMSCRDNEMYQWRLFGAARLLDPHDSAAL